MIDTVRGVLRVRKWPRKRPGKRTPIERFWSDWFKQANLLAKYADPMSQARAIQMTKGSGMYPRDVLLKAMRGRLYAWTTSDGWKWYSMAAIGDVSESLDVLGQTVGDILVRAVDRWRPLAPGVIGDVVTNKGPGVAASWEAPVAVGGFQGGASVAKTSAQTIASGSQVLLTWDSEDYDTNGLHDNAVDNSRITVDDGRRWVRLSAGVIWNSNSTGYRMIRISKNGSIAYPGAAQLRVNASERSHLSITGPVVPVLDDDYFEIEVKQSSGSSRLAEALDGTYFAMELL